MGVCVHIHTDYMYGRWRGAWNTNLVFSNTNLIFLNTDFIFFEHELHELNESWCLSNIILARIIRIVMSGTGSRNCSKGSLTDLTFFLMQWRIDGMKCSINWKRRDCLLGKRKEISWKKGGIFMQRNEYLCKTEGRKWINIQNSGCKQNKGFTFCFQK